MGKLIIFENISLDGYIADDQDGISWVTHDPEVMAQSAKGQPEVGAFLFGRKTFDLMASYWPTQAAIDANPVFATILNQTPKVVFSTTLKSSAWSMTMIEPNLTKDNLLRIKNSTSKNLMIFGSSSIVTTLTQLKLIDEYHLVISPIILGAGKPLFGKINTPTNLSLIHSQAFSTGVVLNQYSNKI